MFHFFVLRLLFSFTKDDDGKMMETNNGKNSELVGFSRVSPQTTETEEGGTRREINGHFFLLPLRDSLRPDKIRTKQEVFYCYTLLLFDNVIKLSFFSSFVLFHERITKKETIGRRLRLSLALTVLRTLSSLNFTRQLKLLSV